MDDKHGAKNRQIDLPATVGEAARQCGPDSRLLMLAVNPKTGRIGLFIKDGDEYEIMIPMTRQDLRSLGEACIEASTHGVDA